jgi:site-specific DNA-methyltransferase (adenine-specific)
LGKRGLVMRRTPEKNTLFYGDNLNILRDHIADESIDLVYLDPPFNSNANYNVLFRAPTGEQSESQIEAFEDTWEWGITAEHAYDEVLSSGNSDAAEMLRAMRSFLRENALTAYLAMMTIRIIELHRVLKKTGSVYLHCDTTASHYLKIILDAVFGADRFLNDITWKRTSAHNDGNRYGRIQDRILFYSKTNRRTFQHIGGLYSEEQLDRFRIVEGQRRAKAENLTAPHFSATRTIEWRGTHPGAQRQWRFGLEELERLWADGRILTKKDGKPRKDGLKEYLDECETPALQDLWTDIPRIANTSAERLGYPTQKPLALLERIISASSNEGDLVLDPFCGCGTTVHAAEKLGRRWIGIDITHLAVRLIQKRLTEAFPRSQFEVLGVPKDAGAARMLAETDKYQFQFWALSMVDAQPYKGGRKGADGGVDGYIYFKPDGRAAEKAVVSVKGGQNVGVGMIRDLIATIEREKAKVGILLTLEDPTSRMRIEAAAAGLYQPDSDQFRNRSYPRIQILTVDDLFAGKGAELPWIDSSVMKKAKREKTVGERKSDQGDLDI